MIHNKMTKFVNKAVYCDILEFDGYLYSSSSTPKKNDFKEKNNNNFSFDDSKDKISKETKTIFEAEKTSKNEGCLKEEEWLQDVYKAADEFIENMAVLEEARKEFEKTLL